MINLTPASVVYCCQIILITLTAGFLWWRSGQPGSKAALLRLAAAVFLASTLLLLFLWARCRWPHRGARISVS